ncbi:hypothetical protein FB451DRAFT_1173324 [Mycena latifolia]|nr:hypothetical protein FB451DRAFT_1173324 [Mycena latifolia]
MPEGGSTCAVRPVGHGTQPVHHRARVQSASQDACGVAREGSRVRFLSGRGRPYAGAGHMSIRLGVANLAGDGGMSGLEGGKAIGRESRGFGVGRWSVKEAEQGRRRVALDGKIEVHWKASLTQN